MMLVCDGCGSVWGAAMAGGCGRCRGALRLLGSDPADAEHPVGRRFPLRRMTPHVRTLPQMTAKPERPSKRATAAEWRDYANAVGHPTGDDATKAELVAALTGPED